VRERQQSARDYKRAARGPGLDPAAGWGFAAGLALGLALAAGVFALYHRHGNAAEAAALLPVPSAAAQAQHAPSGGDAQGSDSAHDAGSSGVGRYDFYRMLPKFEVVVPAHEHGSRPAPDAQVSRPGTYYLQVGSYRDPAVAERVRAEVEHLGIDAKVQRVAVGGDTWNRVRVGPIRDLAELNRLRHSLQATQLDSLVIRLD